MRRGRAEVIGGIEVTTRVRRREHRNPNQVDSELDQRVTLRHLRRSWLGPRHQVCPILSISPFFFSLSSSLLFLYLLFLLLINVLQIMECILTRILWRRSREQPFILQSNSLEPLSFTRERQNHTTMLHPKVRNRGEGG